MDTPDVKTFSVIDAAKGTAYPTKDVTVFTDQDTAFKIALLEFEASETDDDDEVNAIDAQIEALREKIKETALTFHMRGISRGMRIAVEQEIKEKKFGEDTDGRIRYSNAAHLAAHIIRVTNAQGAVDERVFSTDDALELVASLPDESTDKLFHTMQELTFQAAYFDAAVSADFLSKS